MEFIMELIQFTSTLKPDGKEYKKFMLQQKAMWHIEKELSDEEKAAIAKFDSQLKQ